MTEEEQLQLALTASMNDVDAARRASADDIAQQLAQLQAVPTSFLYEDDEPEPDGPPPPLPDSLVSDKAREDAATRRLQRAAPSALVIAKAAVVLRRRAWRGRCSRR